MSEERDGELGELRERARQTAQMLQEQSEELLKTAGRIEALTDGTPEWYPGMRTRVEAQEALRQVRVLLRSLGDSDRSVRAGEGAKSRLPSTPRERMHAPFAATVDQSERRERVRNELEYVEDGVDPGEEQYRSSYHGRKKLYERSVMRLFVDGRRVAVPSGFGGEAKTPKGARPLYRVQVDASDEEGLRDLFDGLEEAKRRKQGVTVEHEIDGVTARYRVVRTSGGNRGYGTLHGELIEGEPVMFDGHGRRVREAEDSGDEAR